MDSTAKLKGGSKPIECLSETEILPFFLQEIESVRVYLEEVDLQIRGLRQKEAKEEAKTGLEKIHEQLDRKVMGLKRYKHQLFGILSNLDYEYYQGRLQYDQYKERIVIILRNKPLANYLIKATESITRCEEKQEELGKLVN